jgi:hypothetical protein
MRALKAALWGPKLTGPMAADPPILYGDRPRQTVATVAVADIKRSNREPDAPSRL